MLGRVERSVLEWQFDERHQLISTNTDDFDIVENIIGYILDAGRSLGVFLQFLGPVNPSVAELCIDANVLSRSVFLYEVDCKSE